MASITSLGANDNGSTSRTTINNNFTNLNADKIEEDSSDTLTNKTIDGDSNTISNLDLGNEVDWAAADDVTDRSAFASGDKVLIYEAGVGMRKVDYDDLPGAGGGLSNVVEDTTPQLGGDLDVNGNKITSVSNGDIDIEPNGTGNVILGNVTIDADQTVGAGQDNYVMTYDHSTGVVALEAAAGGGDSWGDAVDANIVPDADGTRNVGANGTRFANGYFDDLNVGDTGTIDRVDYKQAVGEVLGIGNLSGTEDFNWANYTHFTGTLAGNITVTYSNAVSGQSITLYLSYDGSAQRTITWPTTTWLDNSSGAAPTTPSSSGEVLVVTVQYTGTTYYASATGNYAVYS